MSLHNYKIKYQHIEFEYYLRNSICPNYKYHNNQCDIKQHPTQTEETTIEHLTCNYRHNTPLFYCAHHFKSKVFNILKKIQDINLCDEDFIHCNAQPVIIANAIFSFSLVLFLNNKTINVCIFFILSLKLHCNCNAIALQLQLNSMILKKFYKKK